MTRIKNRAAIAGIILAFPLLVSVAQAGLALTPDDTPGVSFSETTGTVHNVPNLTRGYTIDVTQPIEITALGVFDSGGGALLTSHIVTIWDMNQRTLAMATIPFGTAGNLLGSFMYEPIAPLYLNPGDYTVGVFYPNASGTGDYEINGAIPDLAVNPAFSIVNYTFAHPGYFDPAPYLSDSENFGANFIMTTDVPEPSTLALLGLGAAALVWRRRS